MKRNFSMWMIVIGIIVVGVFVTKVTKEFVSSGSTESAAIMSVLDTSSEYVTEELENFSVTEFSEKGEIDLEEEEEETNDSTAARVKSPLDPAVKNEESYLPVLDENARTAADFQKRWEAAEHAAANFAENKGNDGSFDQAAEQEYRLWDYELNLIYYTIRERMPADEADELKLLELEWMEERDLYADKALAVNKGITAKSAEYLKRMTEKTKERCYWLAEQYKSVLNGRD